MRANKTIEYYSLVILGDLSRCVRLLVCAVLLCAGCATVQPVADATQYAEHQARESEALAERIESRPANAPGADADARTCARQLRTNAQTIDQLQSNVAAWHRAVSQCQAEGRSAAAKIADLQEDAAGLEFYRGVVWCQIGLLVLYLVWRVSRWAAEKYVVAQGGQLPAVVAKLLRMSAGGGPLLLALGLLLAVGRPASATVISPADQARAAFERDVAAVIAVESSGRPWVVSHAGAVGLMQLMPATAQSECGLTRAELFERQKNEACGRRYLGKLQRRFGRTAGLAAYNIGPGTLQAHGYNGAALRYLAKIRDAGGLQ